MKRAAPFLACIFFLLIIGVVAWHFWPRKSTMPTAQPKNILLIGTNVAFVLALTNDLPPPEVQLQVPPQQREEIVGIGAILKTDENTDTLMISGALPNSPAAAAGLAGNFLIRKIDDVSTEGMRLKECVELIRGAAGTKVRLELFNVDANEPMTIELTRQKIQLGESGVPQYKKL